MSYYFLFPPTVSFGGGGGWCTTHFSGVTAVFLSSQMTLDLMAIEIYVFMCHSIYYLSIIISRHLQLALGLSWVLSVSVGSDQPGTRFC